MLRFRSACADCISHMENDLELHKQLVAPCPTPTKQNVDVTLFILHFLSSCIEIDRFYCIIYVAVRLLCSAVISPRGTNEETSPAHHYQHLLKISTKYVQNLWSFLSKNQTKRQKPQSFIFLAIPGQKVKNTAKIFTYSSIS